MLLLALIIQLLNTGTLIWPVTQLYLLFLQQNQRSILFTDHNKYQILNI